MTYGAIGREPYGIDPYGGIYPPFGLESAEALSNTLIRIRFTHLIDTNYGAFLNFLFYTFSPTVDIVAISIESAQTVLITTVSLQAIVYTVTIPSARGYFGQPLDPNLNSVQFTGLPTNPTFMAVGTRSTRVRLVFSTYLDSTNLTTPLTYRVRDLIGTDLTVDTVQVEQTGMVRSLILTVNTPMRDEQVYRVEVVNPLTSIGGLPLLETSAIFRWVDNPATTTIPLNYFKGKDGLWDSPGMFFSPSLLTPTPNSIIQINQLGVCWDTDDRYIIPDQNDNIGPMLHFNSTAPESGVRGYRFNGPAVFWSGKPLTSHGSKSIWWWLELDYSEDLSEMIDDPTATFTLHQVWPIEVSLLNDINWLSYSGAVVNPPTYPATFRFGDNVTGYILDPDTTWTIP